MNRSEVQLYIESHRQAVLATIKRDGRPQLSNVLAVYQSEQLWISITETRSKYHNLVRDSRATILLLGDNFWQYLVVEGRARFTRLPEAMPLLREYYEIASGGAHPNWEEYERAMVDEKRLLAMISIEHVYPVSDD